MAAGRADRAVVEHALASLRGGDWNRLAGLLHPYVRWTTDDGRVFRGRSTVLAYLAGAALSGPPSAFELRDGQIYRWVE